MNTTKKKSSITFYLPGMFNYMGERGQYPAISLTGTACQLNCGHCEGELLKTMIPATTPQMLEDVCRKLDENGYIGCLVSGGSDTEGRLPWKAFAVALKKIKSTTRLKISVHCGYANKDDTARLVEAGVDQCLIDVIGSEKTLSQVYNLGFGIDRICNSLSYLYAADLEVIPHIVIGIHFGKILGEETALQMLQQYPVTKLVLVTLNPLPATAMANIQSVDPQAFSKIVKKAVDMFSDAVISLGCARPRDDTCFAYEKIAIDYGITKIAFPSEEAIRYAKVLNREVFYEKTCCSW